MKHSIFKTMVPFLVVTLLCVLQSYQFACKGAEDEKSIVTKVTSIHSWKFSISHQEMGSYEDLQAEYSRVLMNGSTVYFLDQPNLRFNALNTTDGKVSWGKKGNARFGKYGAAIEDAAFLSGHIIAFSQFGTLFIDSTLLLSKFDEFPRKFFALQNIDSATDAEVVSLSSFSESVEPGTGRRYYARYLTVDRALKCTERIELLGETSHLDAPNPVLEVSLSRRIRRDIESRRAGRPFEIRVVEGDTCVATGSHLLAIPKQFQVSSIIDSFAFDDDTIAFWNLDQANRRYTITVLEYASR